MASYRPTHDLSSISVQIATVGVGNMAAGSHNLGEVGFTPLPGRSLADYFTADDVGMIVMVLGAGAGGSNLVSKIASVTDTQHVVLVDAASTTVTDAESNTFVFRPISVLENSISYDDSVSSHNQAKFTQRLLNGALPVVAGQPFLFVSTDGTFGVDLYGTFFGGEVDSVGDTNWAGTDSGYAECACVSYEIVLTRRVMSARQYSGQTMKQIAQSLVTLGLADEHFDLSSPNGPTPVTFTVENLSYIDSNFDKLMSACNNGSDKYYWKVDQWRKVVIKIQAATPAPFSIKRSDVSDKNVLIQMTNTVTREKFGNQAYISADKALGDDITFTVVNSFLGTAIPSYRVAITLTNKAGIPPTITVGGVAKTVGVSNTDPRTDSTAIPTDLLGFDWLWPIDSDYLFVPNGVPTGPGIPPGGTAVVHYQSAAPANSLYRYASSISGRAAIQGGTGLHEVVVQVDAPIKRTELDAKAESVAKSLGVVSQSLEAVTFRPGLVAGQGIEVDEPSVNALGTYLVESVSLAAKDGWPVWTAKLTIGALIGDWRTAWIDALGLSSSGAAGGVSGFGSAKPLTLNFVSSFAEVGSASASSLIATGGVPGYTFSFHDGSLPTGMSLDTATGQISGTPTVVGSYSFIGRVTDSVPVVQDIACTIVVSDVAPGVVIPGSSITALSGGPENLSDRWIDLAAGNRSVFAPQNINVAMSAYPQDFTLWIYDGSVDKWIGQYLISGPVSFPISLERTIERLYAPLTDQTWTPKGALGKYASNVTPADVPGPDLFSGTSWSVAKMQLPRNDVITALILDTGDGTDWPYNKIGNDIGQQYVSVGLSYNDNLAYFDPNVWTVVITVEDLDDTGASIGPEHVLTDTVPGNTIVDIGPLLAPYGDVADPPRTGMLGGIRFRARCINRIDQSTSAWLNADAETLQTLVGGGAGYVDAVVSVNGDLPPGALLLDRADPASLGKSLNTFGHKLNYGTTDLGNNKVLNPNFEFGTPTATGVLPADDIANWTIAAVVGNGIESTMSVSGNSLRLAASGFGGSTLSASELFYVRPGDKLFAFCDARAASVPTGSLQYYLGFYDDTGGYIGDGVQPTFTAGVISHAVTTFARVKFNTTAPANAAGCRVFFYQAAAASGGFYYVDNVLVQAQISTGTATELDGNGGVQVRVAGPVYADISNNLNLKISAEYVVIGGVLTQAVIDLAKAVNFGTEFVLSGGSLVVNGIAVNKLLAGDALFAGTATFAYKVGAVEGGKVTLNSGGMTFADKITSPTTTLTIAATGMTIAKGGNTIEVTSTGITLTLTGYVTLEMGTSVFSGQAGLKLDNSTYSLILVPGGINSFAIASPNNKAGLSPNELLLTDDGSHFSIFTSFVMRFDRMPSFNPGAGSHQLWYDPSDGNRVKFGA